LVSLLLRFDARCPFCFAPRLWGVRARQAGLDDLEGQPLDDDGQDPAAAACLTSWGGQKNLDAHKEKEQQKGTICLERQRTKQKQHLTLWEGRAVVIPVFKALPFDVPATIQ